MSQKGYYSLVQYCPDDSRLESVNMGLAVFLPDVPRVLIRWATNAKARIHKVFGPRDWVLVEQQKQAIDTRLRNDQDFSTRDSIDRFAETRASAVRLTTARPVKFTHPAEQEFDALFKRLVEDGHKVLRARAITKNLRSVLERRGVAGLVDRHVKVTVPKLNKALNVPYGYRNGRYNLIKPEQFALSTDEQVLQKASMIAIEGQYLFEQPDPELHELRLVLVANFGPTHEHRQSAVMDMMERHNVKMYMFDDLGLLIEDIRSSALKQGGDSMPLGDE